jgi:pimeloyl-ACP methyl ester carboxylesterase
VLWGDRDDVFPVDNARPIVAALPGAELRTIPGAGHWTPMDAPRAVGALVRGFLRPPGAERRA